ncbi:hypothetical protein ACIRL2_42340 [Embleya sp. NPDC127516]|uniref:hypothetical protein n=1 Tax=Embleya sp. NPDC127516 TaxID=3363990 RepID=UPI0037F26306
MLRLVLLDPPFDSVVDTDGLNAGVHHGTDSWATISASPDGSTIATQDGSRRLVDALRTA